MKKTLTGFTIVIFTLCAGFVGVLLSGVLENFQSTEEAQQRSVRVIIPQANPESGAGANNLTVILEENLTPAAPLENGQVAVSILNLVYDASPRQEQIVAFRRANEVNGQIYITLISFDETANRYRQFWSLPTAVTQGGTVSIFSMDLLGDRSNCIVVTGMNNSNEHTMTVFRDGASGTPSPGRPFVKIAEMRADSPIVINEVSRSLAFRQGTANGESFTITAYRQDAESGNFMDQLRVVYAFNPPSGQFQPSSITRLPGIQIEQQRVRELLSGRPGVFENFIHGLWYYESPAGEVQYMYFDTIRREIIFMSENHQQSFAWQRSSPTRYGLHVTSQSNSIDSLRRFIDIELASLDGIHLRVNEPLSMRIMVASPWNGAYNRVVRQAEASDSPIQPDIDAVFDSPWGRIRFYNSGYYTVTYGNSVISGGRYLFFTVNGYNLLELRPDQGMDNHGGRRDGEVNSAREVFQIEALGATTAMLTRVRLGASGISSMQEMPVLLTLAEAAGGVMPAVIASGN
ncbi:MAG: pallilysin-related adhesin [Spirochaetes bacterium]|nr:pallilysin-related adhesin [Spirochaetota bacterium]